MKIDYEKLRKDLEDFALNAHFGGKKDAATLYYEKIQNADESELEQIARECNFPLKDYTIDDYIRRK